MTPTSQPACDGADPTMFDDPTKYTMGLVYCLTCPVKAWCLFTVDPARSVYDGVVGGYIWAKGNLSKTMNDTIDRDADPNLDIYLKACNK